MRKDVEPEGFTLQETVEETDRGMVAGVFLRG